jgi:uncharacterized protein (DUF488 family)
MYYRRKVLLSLLEIFNGQLEKIRLQKLLMLLSKFQEKPSFDFVPYKYGCFSFQANADLKTLIKYEQVIEDGKTWLKKDSKSYIPELNYKDKKALSDINKLYRKKTTEELLEITYKRYPFYAINSTIVDKVLKGTDLEKVNKIKNAFKDNKLFTIGYEGISLEAYLNKLIKYGVKALIDVRRNPLSMKYGFSKKQLETACNGINIAYYHIPELGIESDKRSELKTQSDYDLLFNDYKKSNLPYTIDSQNQVLELLKKHNRIALTCFEANICQCHRKPLAESISKLPNFLWEVRHI